MDTDDGRDSRAPSSSKQDDSIALHHQTCQALFLRCHKALQTAKSDIRVEAQSMPLESQVDRYCIWFKNIAAHQDVKLPSSLEYRIREDENAIRIVKKALMYLTETLEMLLSILTGEKENEKWDSTSELAELSLSIEEGITSLFELSMIIRKKPEKDEYVKAALATSYDPTPDIVHVGDKYPLARSRDAWLMERLGTAITRRRQYLRYRKDHQEKMEQIHEIRKDADGKTVWSGEKASTYVHGDILGKSISNPAMPSDLSSTGLGKRPQTEYADSSKGKDGALDLLRTPLLPKDAKGVRVKYGEYFECPYCWRPQNVQGKNEWKKHVFSDLRPYVCTFEGCGLNMFESQNQWFSHEVRFHRELWLCKFCKGGPPRTRPDLETHLRNTHTNLFSVSEMEHVLDSCAINRIDATCCPLCITYGNRLQSINQSSKCDVSLKQFQEHLGRHMEQLALAALPDEDSDEREADEDDSTSVELSGDGSVESDMARFWIPQATPEGKLFYYNTMTGESSEEPPLDTSLHGLSTQPALTDSSSEGSLDSLSTTGREQRKRTQKRNDDLIAKIRQTSSEEPKRPWLLQTLFGGSAKRFASRKTVDFPEIPGEKFRNRELAPVRGIHNEFPRPEKRRSSLEPPESGESDQPADTASKAISGNHDNSESLLDQTKESGRPISAPKSISETSLDGNNNRNSIALDDLAKELETLRRQWETTNKDYRLSDHFEFDDQPSNPSKDPQSEQNLSSSSQNIPDESEPDIETLRAEWLDNMRAKKRRKRRSGGDVTLSESGGSDTDDEDIQPLAFEGGTSARRLRREVGSLIFDDPPPNIKESEELEYDEGVNTEQTIPVSVPWEQLVPDSDDDNVPRKSEASKFSGKTWSSHDLGTDYPILPHKPTRLSDIGEDDIANDFSLTQPSSKE